MKKHYRHENDCANCGAELQGKFCHVCGQENLELKESFGHMMNHAISDYFHFDHQFFNTLKPLLFEPGKLTNEYMAGKRVRYLHPVKMYIFISLVYFLVFFNNNSHNLVNIQTDNKPATKEELAQARSFIAHNAFIPSDQKEKLIAELNKKNAAKEEKAENYAKEKKHKVNIFGEEKKGDTTYTQYLASQQKLADDKKDGFITRYLRKRAFELEGKNTDVQELVQEGIKHYAPKMMFFLLPLFALLLRITFRKNKKFYVEHLIYSFHFHCFLFLFLTLYMLTQMAIPSSWDAVNNIITWAVTLYVIWYIYRSLRVVYNRSRGRTITKMLGLSFSYTMVFAICMMLLVVIVALFD